MRMASILSVIIFSLFTPAFADDADLKKQVDLITSAYVESFNKQDAAGLAALFATDAIFVNPMGQRKPTVEVFEGSFKAGLNRAQIAVDQVWFLGPDAGLGTGKFRFTGKNHSGAPIESEGFWSAAYVREGGKWKIKMLAGMGAMIGSR